MCGLAGFWTRASADRESMAGIAGAMASRIAHRGPDDAGVWLDPDAGIALGHRRLAIVDLTPAGHQPMHSVCGRYVIAFNGEIYNHLELRERLQQLGQAPQWRGHSDTETLLACCSAWGLEGALQAVVGMFAIALWDRRDQALMLARDRMGEKPLYYGWQDGVFLFGSELKALRAHPAFSARVDRDVLALYLRHNCVPSPYSIYQGIRKLPAACLMRLDLEALQAGNTPQPEPYWQFNDAIAKGLDDPFQGSDEDAVAALEARLCASIGAQMLADVPLGAFLSGGVDSSTVVALMQSQSSRPVRTFTIGLDEGGYDEAHHAKAVASHLGTEHTELYMSPQDALNVIPRLPQIYCEPFGDSSQIPTFLVSQMASHHVTVALSGDAGDELFGGYNRYLSARQVWSRMQSIPLWGRRGAASVLSSLAPGTWDKVFEGLRPLLPARLHLATPGDKAHKLAGVLPVSDGKAFYRQLTSHWADPGSIVIGAQEPPTHLTVATGWPATDSFEHWMMAMDTRTYLQDDILVKVDRAAMANSLETRVPLLDHRVVELAWRMPMRMKIRDGQGKWLLRQVLYRHVPKSLIERPKMGFGIPLDAWLRGPLRDWAEDLLDASRLRDEGFFRPEPIRAMWSEHLAGRRNWQHHLWSVLMFQAWWAEQEGTNQSAMRRG